MNTYTVFIREANGTGTTYITSGTADDIEAAKRAALLDCAEQWDMRPEDLRVLGVAAGIVRILEWHDED